MPTYDYNCTKCKATYEVREGFDAAVSHTCQECGKGTAKRLLTAPRIVFKGSGWYATDSRSKSSAASDAGDSGSGESKSESKSEAKAETKSDAKGASKTESKSESKPETKSSSDSVASAAS
jgi:putative FmdB family regulatory protein